MAITNGYATLSEVKASLRITDNIDDTLLETAIESASRMIDGYTARTFYNAGTAVRNYAATDAINLIIDDAISVSQVASTDEIGDTYTIWDANDYQLEPLNSRSDGLYMPYTGIRAVNTYTWPVVDQQALCRITLLLTSKLFAVLLLFGAGLRFLSLSSRQQSFSPQDFTSALTRLSVLLDSVTWELSALVAT